MKVSTYIADANTYMYMLKYFLLITYLQWSASAKDLFVDKYTILKQQKPFKKAIK